MKKILVLVAVMVLVSTAAFAASIYNTQHDLSATGVLNNEICVFCHAPHAADPSNSIAPLWSHVTTAATFTMYGNPFGTIQGVGGALAGVSRACMSCHDGATAVGTLAFGPTANRGDHPADPKGGTPIASGAAMGAVTGNLGTDLSNDHPVSITYAASDTGLRPAIGATVVNLGVTLPIFGAAGSYTVECASCHNVHDNTTASPFLRASNIQSALCLVCHIK